VEPSPEPLIIVVRPGEDRRRAGEVIRWIRRLLPAAVLLVAPVQLPADATAEVISVDVETVESGPLSLAETLLRGVTRVGPRER